MNIKKHIFQLSIAIAAFLLGYSGDAGLRAVGSFLDANDAKSSQVVAELDSAKEGPVPPEVVVYPPTSTLSETASDVAVVEDFDPTGAYCLPEDPPTKGFKDFEYLEIETHYYVTTESWTPIPIPPNGLIRTKNQVYEFKRIAISPTFIAFETEAIEGISYRFSGRFSVDAERQEFGGSGDFGGKLEKLRYGRVVAEMDAVFIPAGC